MADRIIHGSTPVVNSTAKVTDAALSNVYANTTAADGLVAKNTQLFTVTVDKKGRITQSVAASVNVTGVTFGNTSAHAHTSNQRVYISTAAPANNDIGNNGDIWYQTLS